MSAILQELAAINLKTGMTGKRRRTTEKNPNPLMFGKRRFEMMMSGRAYLSVIKPSKPSLATSTL